MQPRAAAPRPRAAPTCSRSVSSVEKGYVTVIGRGGLGSCEAGSRGGAASSRSIVQWNLQHGRWE